MKAFRNVCLCFINEVQRFRYTTQKKLELNLVSKKSYAIFSKFPIHLYRDWTFCQIHIYTSKTLFVSHQGASWPNHMIQFLSRSVFTHQTTHLGICTWYDLDFQEKLVLFEPKKGIFWLFSPLGPPEWLKRFFNGSSNYILSSFHVFKSCHPKKYFFVKSIGTFGN